MRAETLKPGIIDRLMGINNTSTLKRVDELITQAEMEARAQESLNAIEHNEVISLDDFRKENKTWANGLLGFN